jgi:acyl-CoA synthetase (AMP-forming)/AMP-acid ligase II
MPREIALQSDRAWVKHYPAGIPEHLDYPPEPISWLLEEAARVVPSRIACRFFHQQLTYEQFLDRSRRMAGALRSRGLQPGDRVGILLPNCPEYLIAAFGTWMAGGVTVPLNPLMVREEIAALVKSTNCRTVVCLDLLLPLIRSFTRLCDYVDWVLTQELIHDRRENTRLISTKLLRVPVRFPICLAQTQNLRQTFSPREERLVNRKPSF